MAAKKTAVKIAKTEEAPAAKKAAKKAPAEKKAPAAKKAPVAEKAPAAKKIAKSTAPAKSPARPDEIARAAYLNYRSRVEKGLPGDSRGDWLAAEKQLGLIP